MHGEVNKTFTEDNLDKVLKPLEQNSSNESSLSHDVNSVSESEEGYQGANDNVKKDSDLP